jgi:hypothetical protein
MRMSKLPFCAMLALTLSTAPALMASGYDSDTTSVSSDIDQPYTSVQYQAIDPSELVDIGVFGLKASTAREWKKNYKMLWAEKEALKKELIKAKQEKTNPIVVGERGFYQGKLIKIVAIVNNNYVKIRRANDEESKIRVVPVIHIKRKSSSYGQFSAGDKVVYFEKIGEIQEIYENGVCFVVCEGEEIAEEVEYYDLTKLD